MKRVVLRGWLLDVDEDVLQATEGHLGWKPVCEMSVEHPLLDVVMHKALAYLLN